MEKERRDIMDITFKTNEGIFNYRVCAIILHNNQLLAMKDEHSPYYYLPGGRVQLHETAENAILRELKEELGIDATISRPLWFNQSFFTEDVTHQKYHELCLYYLIDFENTHLLSKGKSFIIQENHKTHQFEWLPIDTLDKQYLYPLFIKQHIHHLPTHLTMMIENE